MPAVDSSAILRIRYQPQGETLLVTFITGKTYAYDGVPAPIYDAFLAADSYGQFFNAHIRDRYSYHAVRG
jgi:lysyl-tRNA synthetase class 2